MAVFFPEIYINLSIISIDINICTEWIIVCLKESSEPAVLFTLDVNALVLREVAVFVALV